MSGKLKKLLLDALFPPNVACLSCRRECVPGSDGLCSDCHAGLELFVAAPPPNETEGYTAAYIYNDVSSRMITRLKFSGARYLAKPLADAIRLPKEWGDIDAVVPVPLYYRRQNKRGYNQSELIARHLCERLDLKLDTELLIRSRNTEPQTELSEAGRRKNLKDAFVSDDSCTGKTILLLDDVRATGTTLGECAAELKRNGAKRVYAVTVCCAHLNDEGGA